MKYAPLLALGTALSLAGCEEADCIQANATALTSFVEASNNGQCEVDFDDTSLRIHCSDSELMGESRDRLSLIFLGPGLGFELLGNERASFRCGSSHAEITDPEVVTMIGAQIKASLRELEID
ncbi:hypothetical protein HOG48_02945 [Candidatus Peregrinibacteria bacterium]|jgi:hypothetical protein|nr:hypothetical protein [Candidatus Peregrinibacteria bacterium]